MRKYRIYYCFKKVVKERIIALHKHEICDAFFAKTYVPRGAEVIQVVEI